MASAAVRLLLVISVALVEHGMSGESHYCMYTYNAS